MNRAGRAAVPAALLITGAAMMLFGIFSGEAAAVLRKAILICLECIGIG